jgi:protease-4
MEQRPSQQTNPTKTDVFFKYAKNFFMILLILQFAPIVFSGLKNFVDDNLSPCVHIGHLTINGFLGDASPYEKTLEKLIKNPDIKGLILKINSPGGLPGTAQVIFSELKRFKEKKPVVVVVENICTSAAYYVAAASNCIICAPSALMGSVGVLCELPNVKELLSSWKIKVNCIQSGDYKTAGSPIKDSSDKELAYLQQLSDDVHKQFIKDIVESRKNSGNNVSLWANGKVFTGNQALTLRLVDKIGSFNDGILEMKKMLKLDKDAEIKLIKPKKTSKFMRLFGDDDSIHSSLANKCAFFASNAYNNFLFYQKNSQPVLL